MMRPAALFRVFSAPSRRLVLQFTPAPSLTPVRRCLATASTTSSLDADQPTRSHAPESANPAPATASAIQQRLQSELLAQHQHQQPQQQPPHPTLEPQPPSAPRSLPYHVSRTPSKNLAVYHLAKRGGNKKLTLLKKIDGDREALRSALARALGLGDKDVVLNTLTKHISVVGHRRNEVITWLEQQGF